MDKPKFFYQNCESKYPGYVAVMSQFLPTFDSKEGVIGGEDEESNVETAGETANGENKDVFKIQY